MKHDFSLTYTPQIEYNEIGYHTTLAIKKNEILENGFIKSTKNNEWLGEGAYFWDNEKNAQWWKSTIKKSKKCIFVCELKCPIENYLDLDVEMDRFETYLRKYQESMNSQNGFKPKFKSNDERRKFYCDIYCIHNNICILAFTFVHDKFNLYGFKTGSDRRRQICVRDVRCISIVEVRE